MTSRACVCDYGAAVSTSTHSFDGALQEHCRKGVGDSHHTRCRHGTSTEHLRAYMNTLLSSLLARSRRPPCQTGTPSALRGRGCPGISSCWGLVKQKTKKTPHPDSSGLRGTIVLVVRHRSTFRRLRPMAIVFFQLKTVQFESNQATPLWRLRGIVTTSFSPHFLNPQSVQHTRYTNE